MKCIQGLLLPMLLFIIGCDENINITDGLIPESYLSDSKKLVGKYQGQMAGRQGTIELSIVDNKAIFNFQSIAGGTESLVPGCKSEIGNLLEVRAVQQIKLLSVFFNYTPQGCSLEDRSLALHFQNVNGQISIYASILRKTVSNDDYQTSYYYLDGNFTKIEL